MEPPVSFDANVVRDKQAEILKAIQPFHDRDVLLRTVRGQYGPTMECPVTARSRWYLQLRAPRAISVSSCSSTIGAGRMFPFMSAPGSVCQSALPKSWCNSNELRFVLFRKTAVDKLEPNRLVLHLQPDEGISLSFGAKIPGPVVRLGEVDMAFNYADYFNVTPQTGYERLMYECMLGGRNAVPAIRYGGSGLEYRRSRPECLGGAGAPGVPELCGRDLGTGRGR
jgi:glucose-6-phosphate 1-dehydrogenase